MGTISGESNPGQPWKVWAPSFTGFSADPTATVSYVLIGKTCHVMFTGAGGTSNATTATFTLPFAKVANGTNDFVLCLVQDAGALQAAAGRIILASNSNIATVNKTLGGGGWTASGTKMWFAMFSYQIA